MLELARERIVVTGGAGFLGRVVCDLLHQRGVVDDQIIVPRSRDYDLTVRTDVDRLYRDAKPTVVIHLAARVGGIGANREHPGAYFYANMAMGLHLIEAARWHGLRKFVQVGTVCAYPKYASAPFREETLWDGYPEETNAPYGVAKKALFVMLDGYQREYGLKSAVVVPVNLYGPGDNFDPLSSHVIPALIKKCEEARLAQQPSIDVWGTGTASREFLYVDDCARGIVAATERMEEPIPINLGTGQEITIKALITLIAMLCDYHGVVVWDPSKPDGQPRRQLDVSRARQLLDWSAEVSFEEGLKKNHRLVAQSARRFVMTRRPRIAILYHFLHPDDVVSAQLFSLLAADLAQRGWDVEALASNRSCHAEATYRPSVERWRDVLLRRIWRPQLKQASSRGRILNALWMIVAWSTLAFRSRQRLPDVLFIGTDPVLSILVAGVMKTLRPRVKVVHWAFDLYPEAAIADGLIRADSRFVRLLQGMLGYAYRSCDLVADLGQCMRDRLAAYGHQCPKLTLPPWALVEPTQTEKADQELRRQLFGDARLTLLYSGNFGRAHEFVEFLELARRLRNTGIVMGFSVRGNRVEELKAAITPEDTNIRFLPFAAEADLGKHLATGDVHLVSLRQNWTGIVVPSKFFGSLASGRPVLFAGEAQASISRWIDEHQVGWRISMENTEEVARQLIQLAETRKELDSLQLHCWKVYQQHFSRLHIVERFDLELKKLVSASQE